MVQHHVRHFDRSARSAIPPCCAVRRPAKAVGAAFARTLPAPAKLFGDAGSVPKASVPKIFYYATIPESGGFAGGGLNHSHRARAGLRPGACGQGRTPTA
jgi:hypothetical protein